VGYVEDQDAPRLADEAAIRRGVVESMAATETTQQDAARFFTEFGAAVLPGHAPVGRPGDIGSDPDTYGPDTADRG
jgi:hypothetical protein